MSKKMDLAIRRGLLGLLLSLLGGHAQQESMPCSELLRQWPTDGSQSQGDAIDPVGEADCALADILIGRQPRSFQERLRAGINKLETLLQRSWQDPDQASLRAAMAVRRNLGWAESMVDGHAENWTNMDRAFAHYSVVMDLHRRGVEAGFSTQPRDHRMGYGPVPVTIFDLWFSGRICRDPMTLPPTEVICGDKEAPLVEHEPLVVERARRSQGQQWSLHHLYIDHMKRSLTDFIYGGRFRHRRKLYREAGEPQPLEPDWADIVTQVQDGDCQKHAGGGACDHPWQVRSLVNGDGIHHA